MFDSPPTYVDAHLADYFLHEMIASFSEAAAHSLQKAVKAKISYQTQRRQQTASSVDPRLSVDEAMAGQSVGPLQPDIDEAHRMRMDAAGYKVGWALAERITKDKPRFPRANQQSTTVTLPDPLELIKFVCKDVWMAMYNKQADNLRTNHKGIYVIQDHSYRPFLRISVPVGYEKELDKACRRIVAFPLAVIRGALTNLGLHCVVSVEIALPQCTFQIRTLAPAVSTLPTTTASTVAGTSQITR
ncbi:hypothetical protein O181_073265 [Austropuccinia psidii MF-1]|uniref:Trafficking protein particle complex subunit 6B n=1 Tax=Austropuccinia psidii MF-1 TaxID=1389203 RepID=A0A9Q3F253_9BASI|nr:hypothetical protein [Austropuccinia psidii MF-1]